MRVQRYFSLGILSASLVVSLAMTIPAFAQGAPTVSAVTLQVVNGPTGQQVLTPKGMAVPLPGAGVNSNTVQIYMGSQGGFWYVDRNGQNVDLTAAVAQFRAMTGGQAPVNQQVPQYAPAPPVVVNNETSNSGSSGGGGMGTGLATAAAAGLGAMTGAAISGSYYNNVPYGTPVYYPRGGANPYYMGAGGNTVNVNHSYTGPETNNYYNAHATNIENQQKWYENQQKNNPQQFKNWQQNNNANPFVADGAYRGNQAAAAGQQEGRGRFGRRGGSEAATADGGGRLGQADGNGGGGRFGRGNAEGGGGGRFGRGNAEGGGGRFGGRLGGGGGEAGAGAAQGGGGRFGGGANGGGRRGGRFGNRQN